MDTTRRLSFGAPGVALMVAWGMLTPPSIAAAQGTPSRPVALSAPAALPRTPWGDPDIQGTWPGGPLMSVPFERAAELGTRATLTPEEVAKRNADVDAQRASPPLGNFWPELGYAPPLTSLIVEPENGRLPPMTEDGARRAEEWRVKSADGYYPRGLPAYVAAGPTDLRPFDRCITRGVLGSAFPNQYGSGMQIHQAPAFVVIRHEMVHEARVIPLDPSTLREPQGRPEQGRGATGSGSPRGQSRGERPHISSTIQSYMGDPRGWWDGDTLVVETTNFNGRTGSYARNGDGNPTSTALRLVERFRLRDKDTLLYEVLVEDPQTWVRSWKVAFPIRRDETYILHEYACHEGNYALRNILSAARAAERDKD